MKIRLAKTAGFCMGVRRAVEAVLDLQRSSPPLPIVTYGPLIHNPQTLQLLESRGIKRVDSLDEIRHGTVVIRAHGISPQERRVLQEKDVRIIDATCPRVARVQAVIRKHAAQGDFCVIVGDEDHPEVRGLIGFASAGGLAVSDPGMNGILETIPRDRGVCVVAQTTQEIRIFDAAVEALNRRCPDLHVYNTICDSTRKRQAEVNRLAAQSEMIVVVGGKGSGNTKRLVQVAEAHGVRALHVETDEEIDPSALSGIQTVSITAGASTPNWQILRVIDRLKEIGRSSYGSPFKVLRRIADVGVMTYCLAALGGGGLTAACLVLQGRPPDWLPLAVTMLFVFSMHLLNRIQDRSGAVRFNTPEIAAFYARHRGFLAALGALSSVAAVILSFVMGRYSGFLVTAMVVTGLFYTAPLIPSSTPRGTGWRSLKDLPGSKTPLVAAGWGVAASILPVISSDTAIQVPGLAVTFLFAAGMVFWRTALSDLLDIQGDRIVGRETIPILIGVRKTGRLLSALLVALALMLIVCAQAGWITSVGYVLVLNTVVFGAFFVIYRRRHILDRLSFEGMIDGNLILAGLLGILYGMA